MKNTSFSVYQMTDNNTTTSTTSSTTSPPAVSESAKRLRDLLQELYRADLLKIANALCVRPRSNYYHNSSDLISLIVEESEELDLKDDWLLRVNAPWTMFLPQPALDVLKEKQLEECNVETLREICRQYSIKSFSSIPTKLGLVALVRELVVNLTHTYPPAMYTSRITKRPIPSRRLIMKRAHKPQLKTE